MYEAVIGLEVHLQLKTRTKAFCGCSTEFGKIANSQTCPVCLGFPGSLPVLNKLALNYALRVALALNCHVQEYTKFDRKNYFYPDLPKNYQISQYDLPLSKEGFLDIDLEGSTKRVRIRRVHLEEDAGKLIHQKDYSLVDFNRAGIPLLEIVSEPDINSPQEAYEYLTCLKSTVEYLEVSDCDMEKGSLRCDANISLRKAGSQELGTKTELKNMNSFKSVKDALSFEIERQTRLLKQGKAIQQETRLWDVKVSQTISMRTKEETQDYRYFPEPDLPPFIIEQDEISEIKKTIPELPQDKMLRFVKDYGLSQYEAKIVTLSKKEADRFEEGLRRIPDEYKKTFINLWLGPLHSEANSRNISLAELEIPGGIDELIQLVKFQAEGKISGLMAKSVLNESISSGISLSQLIQDKNLFQISDAASLDSIVTQVLKENPKTVDDYAQGNKNALMFLVGAVMKKTEGRANPKLVQDILKRLLK